jgi:hypothetical protein
VRHDLLLSDSSDISGVEDAPRAVSIADVDGDGDQDVAVVSSLSPLWYPDYASILSIYSSDGQGGFSPPIEFLAGDSSRDLAVGDLDRDGRMDVATTMGLGVGYQGAVVHLNRLEGNACATLRTGSSGALPRFTSTSVPVLGQPWTSEVDAAGHPGALLTVVAGHMEPLAGLRTPIGELLIDLGSLRAFLSVAVLGGPHATLIPNDLALIDVPIFTQAAILGGGAELTNAIDLVLGL